MPLRELIKSYVRPAMSRSVGLRSGYGLINEGMAGLLWSAGYSYRSLDAICRSLRICRSDRDYARFYGSLEQMVASACLTAGRLRPCRQNDFLAAFQASSRARSIRAFYAAQGVDNHCRLRKARKDGDLGRQGNLILLKRPNASMREKGVLLLMFNSAIEEFSAVYDVARMTENYQFVLEPSTTNYIEPYFFCYLGSDVELIVQCTQDIDFDFFSLLGHNFAVIRMGGGDWVDDSIFKPKSPSHRSYDAVLVGFWGRLKRHHVLFEALNRIGDDSFKVALVGYPFERSRRRFNAEMQGFGVGRYCTVFESIPPAQVADILADSKMNLLLSKKEGSNRAIYEGFFCDTPAIVYDGHVGINLSHLNLHTGILSSDEDLAAKMSWMRNHYREFTPRAWAMSNTGSAHSTVRLNQALKSLAESRGGSWQTDIVEKANRPQLRYRRDEDRNAMSEGYRELAQYLL